MGSGVIHSWVEPDFGSFERWRRWEFSLSVYCRKRVQFLIKSQQDEILLVI